MKLFIPIVSASIAVACMATTPVYGQSGANPFGKPSANAINAIRAWSQLSPMLRQSLEQQMAGMTEEQRRAYLASVPSLKNLSTGEIDAILAQLPGPPRAAVLVASSVATVDQGMSFAVGAAGSDYVGPVQPFVAQNAGSPSRIEIQTVCHPWPYSGTGDIRLDIVPLSAPLGTAIASATVSGQAVQQACASAQLGTWLYAATVSATVSGSGTLSTGGQYLLKASSSAGLNDAAFWGLAPGDPYAGGEALMLRTNGTFEPLQNWFYPTQSWDFLFSIYATPAQ